ncbi:type II toxin-antitoxin system HicA family toxin [Acaryochloris marina]|uniref:type II toxin-antitoxin system HicA family toxin n=1 Tax=Acaryochloris marina TaxID=155978 RepID=UPI001BAEFF46|nr:type II toxin-antitoxin system HicA family toxin [Acaryochloris marina]QUY43542.1 type II toxin-antitoxin system HicA family toxin [Acaryochloris marina S15]
MNSKQRKILERLFADPISGNIRWSDIESLLVALGATITEGNGSRIRVVLGDLPAIFHRPHPEPTAGKLLVKAVRKYLKDAGVENA